MEGGRNGGREGWKWKEGGWEVEGERVSGVGE